MTCRRCSECAGQLHHWLDNDECYGPRDATHACKHCDALGDECETCGGEGGRTREDGESLGLCPHCKGYGVIEREVANPGQQPGSCSPACVHLMEAAMLSTRLIEAEERADALDTQLQQTQADYGAMEARAEQAEATARHALGLLNRWLSQHREGGTTDPCGVARELVAETLAAVRP